MSQPQAVIEELLTSHPVVDEVVDLNMGYCSCRLQSNSTALLAVLKQYFSFIVEPVEMPTYTLQLIESEAVDFPVEFVDWQREPGKTGRKDSYIDLEHARLIRKVRTGMVFLQSQQQCLAIGPCLENDNQVINFIASQMMNWLQQNDWLICHAAAIVHQGETYAVAGFSGGGKSSLMLNMLEKSDTQFLSNDRLFIQRDGDSAHAAGIPKMPRINPGTIVHNERLQALIPDQERQQLLAMPNESLWDLEQKYDADIERFYGAGRISYQAPLNSLLILNWARDATDDVALNRVDLRERPELLEAVMKSPGPFYQDKDGDFISDEISFDQERYLLTLEQVNVYEATGKIDFEQLTALYLSA